MGKKKINVIYIFRAKKNIYHSLERVFNSVIGALPTSISVNKYYLPKGAAYPLAIFINALSCIKLRKNINHITGDVHYASLFLKKNKTVLTIADCVALKNNRGYRRIYFWLFWFWLPIKRSCIVTTISKATKREVLKHFKCSPQKIKVIYCPLPENFNFSIKKFNYKKPIILHFSTFENKNLNRTIEAIKDIDCHLRVIGTNTEEQNLTIKNYNIECSTVHGLTDNEIVEEYKKCDMLCFPSTYEGFGMPVIEAQAIGRPVVSGDVCSLPEVAGENACLVDPYSVDSIRKGILKIIDNKSYRNNLIKDGLENVKRFRPEAIAKQYAEIYGFLSKDN